MELGESLGGWHKRRVAGAVTEVVAGVVEETCEQGTEGVEGHVQRVRARYGASEAEHVELGGAGLDLVEQGCHGLEQSDGCDGRRRCSLGGCSLGDRLCLRLRLGQRSAAGGEQQRLCTRGPIL
eukprot:scaffold73941_cov53-Phaeocystis_antarctica.AAC.3